MNRRRLLRTAARISGVSILGTTGVVAQGGQGRDNRRRRDAECVDGVTVEVEMSDPETYNFEENREPACTGPDVYGFEGSGSAFWLGVSAPDGDGIQHEISHRGQAVLYLTDDAGNWYEVRAQFDGNGNLVNVNGVSP